jgi:hypothetical protein
MTSSEIDKLTENVRQLLNEKSTNLGKLQSALEQLLTFLTTSVGRTDANCRTVDSFFMLHAENGFSWDHLPEELQAILDDMSMQLHDTVSSPQVAENFESTPEQLLARLRRIK